MQKNEIDLLDFSKKILSSFKLITICVLVMLGIGAATFTKNSESVLEVRIHDQNGTYDNDSVDYIRHLLIVNTKLINRKKDYSNINDIKLHPSSDSISIFVQIKSREVDVATLKKFTQEVLDVSHDDYITFYQKKNSWVENFDDNVGNDRIEKYNFNNLDEYRNFIFWKNYTGQDIFLIEFVNEYYTSDSIIKRILISIGFGLFLGIALSIVRIAIKE